MKTNVVVLVHGFLDHGSLFNNLRHALRRKGFEVYAINLKPNFGLDGIEPLAEQLKTLIDSITAPAQTIALIGFSMGGIVSRYYLQTLGGLTKVHRFISIASPHQGTYIAYLIPFKACRQMLPGSRFLAELNKTVAVLDSVNPMSLWTPYDLVIVPRRSAILETGKTVQLPVWFHRWMARDKRVISHIEQALLTT